MAIPDVDATDQLAAAYLCGYRQAALAIIGAVGPHLSAEQRGKLQTWADGIPGYDYQLPRDRMNTSPPTL